MSKMRLNVEDRGDETMWQRGLAAPPQDDETRALDARYREIFGQIRATRAMSRAADQVALAGWSAAGAERACQDRADSLRDRAVAYRAQGRRKAAEHCEEELRALATAWGAGE